MKKTVILLALLVSVAGCRCPMMSPCNEDCLKGASVDSNSRVSLEIVTEVKEATVAKGIKAHVAMTNKGPGPFVTGICPAMELCCVKNLHPMLAYDDTGLGLLDLCMTNRASRYSIFLPVGTTFSFDLTIPLEKLPDNIRVAGKVVQVYVAYRFDDGTFLESNRSSCTLK